MLIASLTLAALAFQPVAPTTPAPQPTAEPAAEPASTQTLPEARSKFTTTLNEHATTGNGTSPTAPPEKVFSLIKYKSPAGDLAAYLTPDPKDGKKHPAIIVATGGFGGIGASSWNIERYTGHFRNAGLIVMCPSWRGQQGNPGKYECMYGEIDDALAALEHLRSLPYVDTSRIYMTGHSTGGTVTMLACLMTDKIRAGFPLGGNPTFMDEVDGKTAYGRSAPYDTAAANEAKLRSFSEFATTLKTPLFYFEGETSPYPPQMQALAESLKGKNVPLSVYTIKLADHFNIVDSINALIAARIAKDTGPAAQFSFTPEEVNTAFINRRPPFEPKVDRTKVNPIVLSATAMEAIKSAIAEKKIDTEKTYVRVGMSAYYRQYIRFDEEVEDTDMLITMPGFKIAMDPTSINLMFGTRIDFDAESGFDYENPNEN